jgi:hypothetical protein
MVTLRDGEMSHIFLLAFALILIISFPKDAQASSGVTLAWDPATDVAGYRLYCGTASGVYTQTLEVGNTTQTLVSNLVDGQTYFFAVTAYNSGGLESSPSNEVSYQLPPSIGTAATTTVPTPTPIPQPPATPHVRTSAFSLAMVPSSLEQRESNSPPEPKPTAKRTSAQKMARPPHHLSGHGPRSFPP